METFCFELILWLRSNGNVVFVNFKHFTGGHFTETQEAKLEIIRIIIKFGLPQMNIYLLLFIHCYFDSVYELKKITCSFVLRT